MLKSETYWIKKFVELPRLKTMNVHYTVYSQNGIDIITRGYLSDKEVQKFTKEGFSISARVDYDLTEQYEKWQALKAIDAEFMADILQHMGLSNHPLGESFYKAAIQLVGKSVNTEVVEAIESIIDEIGWMANLVDVERPDEIRKMHVYIQNWARDQK